MRKIITILLMAVFPLCLSAEKKVSKITRCEYDNVTHDNYYEYQLLSYDESGRLINWTEIANDKNKFDVSFNYISDNKIVLSGIFDYDNDVMEVSLDDNGLVKTATSQNTRISIGYNDGLMSELIWEDLYYSDQERTTFEIVNGNPTMLISDYWSSGYPTITYTDIPNKSGLIYLPMITSNTAWGYRCLAYAGLQGYGSRTLPYSCQFRKYKPAGIIDYVLDNEGYVISMVVENGNDGDGTFTFEYCDVNGVDDVVRADVHVLGGQGCITIEGEYVSAKVYDLSGMRYPGTENLVPGIYIVDVDGMKFKAAVN